MRVLRSNMLLSMVIPGPKTPQNLDSFLVPVFRELVAFEAGIPRVWDGDQKRYFTMRVMVPLVATDWIARVSVMHTSGPAALSFCDYCEMKGVKAGGVYSPHTAPKENIPPDKRERLLERRLNGEAVYDLLCGEKFQYTNPPRQTDEGFRKIANDIQEASKTENVDDLVKLHGIKGRSIFMRLNAIVFPWSFPPCGMHLYFENICSHMTRHYRGVYFRKDENQNDANQPSTVNAEEIAKVEAELIDEPVPEKKPRKKRTRAKKAKKDGVREINESEDFTDFESDADSEDRQQRKGRRPRRKPDNPYAKKTRKSLGSGDLEEIQKVLGAINKAPNLRGGQSDNESVIRGGKGLTTDGTGSCIVIDADKEDYTNTPFLKYVIANQQEFAKRERKQRLAKLARKQRADEAAAKEAKAQKKATVSTGIGLKAVVEEGEDAEEAEMEDSQSLGVQLLDEGSEDSEDEKISKVCIISHLAGTRITDLELRNEKGRPIKRKLYLNGVKAARRSPRLKSAWATTSHHEVGPQKMFCPSSARLMIHTTSHQKNGQR